MNQASSLGLPPAALPWLGALVAVLVGLALLEGVVLHRRRRDYDWRAAAASLGDAALRQGVASLGGLSVALPLLVGVQAHALTTVDMHAPLAWLGLFFGEELMYYAYHRAAHRVGWFWATHCVHHSPQQLSLATAFRLGWTGPLSGNSLFFAPLVWLGFPLPAVLAMLAVNLLYQFGLHAPWMPRWGALEWVLNTPAHHRVHHGSNPEYLDCNYGGILIVFDRWFGSFAAESADAPIRYGLVQPLRSHNPLRISVHGWWTLGRAWRAARGWRARLAVVLGPPCAWPPAAPRARAPQPTVDIDAI